jgi:2-dehydropantoate 2-reductase
VKILIVGAGGIGGYFGARLIQTGADVTYLLREKRQKLIQEQGLCIETPTGNFVVHPQTVRAEALQPIYDLIILAPKAYDLADSLQSIAKASSGGVILPFLNGLTHLQILDQAFGKSRVMGGVAHIGAMITENGSIKQLTDLNVLTVGHRSDAHRELAQKFHQICDLAEFKNIYSDNIEQGLWDKWVFLATLAGMTTVTKGNVGQITVSPYGKTLTERMYQECCAIAKAHQFPIIGTSQSKALELLTQKDSSFSASMLRDLNSHHKTEHEHVLGEMIRLGEQYSVNSDLLKLAYTHMTIEEKNK